MTNRNEVGGKIDKAIGTIKERLGRATGNRRLEEQGSADRTVGSVRHGVGKVERKIDEAIDSAARDLREP
jgi:uncharacterized protein YjbJ (UPF0337 family)